MHEGVCGVQEHARQQRQVVQAAKAAGLSHKITVADAQQVLGCADPAACLTENAAAPVPPADVFLSEPFYSSLESLPPWSQLRSSSPPPPPPKKKLLPCCFLAPPIQLKCHRLTRIITHPSSTGCALHLPSASFPIGLGPWHVCSFAISIPFQLTASKQVLIQHCPWSSQQMHSKCWVVSTCISVSRGGSVHQQHCLLHSSCMLLAWSSLSCR